jgi:hypothetical protein
LEGQVPVFTSPKNRVAQFYAQALGCLFIASYDSQYYDGGIRTRLHTGVLVYKQKEREGKWGGSEIHYIWRGGKKLYLRFCRFPGSARSTFW